MNLFNNDGAHFSQCRKYRYALWRIWDKDKPLVAFIGLNPSRANEDKDDPTIRRVIGMAKSWGYGGVYMLNLFSLVSSNPERLLTCDDPINGNDEYLKSYASRCKRIVFAWGAFKKAAERAKVVSAMFPDAYALHINADGSPKHPLYVRKDVVPLIFKQAS